MDISHKLFDSSFIKYFQEEMIDVDVFYLSTNNLIVSHHIAFFDHPCVG